MSLHFKVSQYFDIKMTVISPPNSICRNKAKP